MADPLPARPLVLSPGAVWLTITQGVAQHIRPVDAASWQHFVARFGLSPTYSTRPPGGDIDHVETGLLATCPVSVPSQRAGHDE